MSYSLKNEPSRGIGGETDKRDAFARWAELPGGGNSVNITEDVRKYAAEPTISEEEALAQGMADKSEKFVQTGGELYQKG